MAQDNNTENTFQRSWHLTIIGLTHITYGFFSTLWSCIRVLIIGTDPVMYFGSGYVLLIYLFEAHGILFWASGIGILRNKRWGIVIGLASCLASLFFSVANLMIRKSYWGLAAPSFSWGFYLVLYYSIIYSMVFFIVPLLKQSVLFSDLLDNLRSIDVRYMRSKFANIKLWRNR